MKKKTALVPDLKRKLTGIFKTRQGVRQEVSKLVDDIENLRTRIRAKIAQLNDLVADNKIPLDALDRSEAARRRAMRRRRSRSNRT